jgi:hypothetical protein
MEPGVEGEPDCCQYSNLDTDVQSAFTSSKEVLQVQENFFYSTNILQYLTAFDSILQLAEHLY